MTLPDLHRVARSDETLRKGKSRTPQPLLERLEERLLLSDGGLEPAATDTLKIYLLAGQSNMEGQAYTYDSDATAGWNVTTMEFLLSGTPAATNYRANMPFDFEDSLDASWLNPRDDAWGVHYYSGNGTLKNILPTNDPADIVTGIQPLSPGFGVGTNFGSMIGLELAMGIRLADLLESPVFLFKSDRGGTTLGNDWRPPLAVSQRGGVIGPEYTNTMTRFIEFLDDLDADLADNGVLDDYNDAVGYEVCGLVWFQGWNEQYGDGPYTAAQLQAEYTDNLVDLVHSVRDADARIPNDLGMIIGESSDQHAGLNAGRIAAVAELNAEIPNSAAYFDTDNMIGTDWGNNEVGVPFSQGWGYHFHARAENFLEIGWKAAGAVIDTGMTGSESVGPGVLVIDHEDTDLTALSEAEINKAKADLHIAYGHTSHGSQLTTGMTGLVGFANGGGLELSLPTDIFAWNNGGVGGALDLHDGAMVDDCGYYPDWVNNTRSYLDNPANADVNVILWSWCGQVDEKYAAGTLDSEYLTPMSTLEADYPNVTFVYMTGHVDHWDDANNKAANQMIRDYSIANDKVLYDFADIESYDPDGVYYEFPHDNCDYYESVGGPLLGNWATEWQDSHTEGDDWYSCSSAHSQPLNANRKAYGAWALWTQIAARRDDGGQDPTDLAWVGHLTVPPTVEVGQDFSIGRTVEITDADVLANFQIAYYRSGDADLDAGDPLVTTEIISQPSDKTVGQHAGSTTGAIAEAGTYWLFGVLDSGGGLDEIDEDNNEVISAAEITVLPVGPTIASLSVAPPVAQIGQPVTLTANGVSDVDGQVVEVSFYQDANDNGTLDVGSDTLIGTDGSSVGGWTAPFATAGMSAGVVRYFAQAKDNDHQLSAAVTATGELVSPPAVEERFDFGTSGSPVEAGYTRVHRGTSYSVVQGYGWTSTPYEKDRGSPTALTRDFNYVVGGSGGAKTFALDVPNGQYQVTVTLGDADRSQPDQKVFLEDQLVLTVTTAGNEFFTQTYPVTVADGRLDVKIQSGSAAATLNALEVLGGNDEQGPRVIDASPSGTQTQPIDRVRLTFDEPVADGTFTLGDVRELTGPAGPIAASGVHKISGTQYEVVFPQQTASGAYSLTIGPGIEDAAGNEMSQDGDAANGEDPDDRYTASLTLIGDEDGPRVTGSTPSGSLTGPVDRVTVTFNESIADGTFTLADVVALTGPGGAFAASGVHKITDTQYEVVFPSQSDLGAYSLTIGPDIEDTAGNAMNQDGDAINGEDPADAYTAAFSLTVPPSVDMKFDFGTGISPVEAGYTRVHSDTSYDLSQGYGWTSRPYEKDRGSAGALTRDFNYVVGGASGAKTFAVDLPNGLYSVTATLGDASRSQPDQMLLLEGVLVETVTTAAGEFFTQTYPVEVSDGQLNLTIQSGSSAATLNAVEILAGDDEWGPRVIDAAPSGAQTQPFDRVRLTFDEPVADGTFTLGDVRELTGPAGPIAASGVHKISGTQYEVVFPQQTASGAYSLTIGPGIEDTAGNEMNQDGDAANGEDPDDRHTTSLTLTADEDGPRVTASTPSGSLVGPVDRVTLTFNEAVADGTFTLADVVALTGPGGPVAASAVHKLSDTQYKVLFPSQSDVGAYSMTIGPDIEDAAGNAMNQDGDAINGEDPADAYTAAFSLTAPPSVDMKFDFGTGISPVEAGYARVHSDTSYDVFQGYGWTSRPYEKDRGSAGALTRDFNYVVGGASGAKTFAVDLPNGLYSVTATLGDASRSQPDQMLFLEGALVDTITTARGEFFTQTYQVLVSDGQLALKIQSGSVAATLNAVAIVGA